MKIRNGFVSNSSSSSFIINYPKEELRLGDIESYFGGYNSNIPVYLQEIMNYVLWKTQFNGHYKVEETQRHNCSLYKVDDNSFTVKCPKMFSYVHGADFYDDEDNPCYDCKYWKSISEEQYVESLIENSYWSRERAEQLQNFKKNCGRVKCLEIEDSGDRNEDLNLSYSDASEIRRYVGEIFKSHDRIIEDDC